MSRVIARLFLHRGFGIAVTRRLPRSIAVTVQKPWTRGLRTTTRLYNVQEEKVEPAPTAEKLEFQAETRMLLDIVAKSLYSDKEVFIRELISNANDALERFRYETLVSGGSQSEKPLEIHLNTSKLDLTFTIEDKGIGMTREEMIQNLGTIARSGSKAFVKQVQTSGTAADNIIGQFGVGFYSAFMVADKVEVFSRSSKPGNKAHRWMSDGQGSYEIAETDDIDSGTKIIVHLRKDCQEFSDEERIKEIIKKYSNFVGNPILLNGKRVNTLEAVWLMDPKDVSQQTHDEFYRYVSNSYDRPRYCLHYKTDAPLNIRCLLYFPEHQPGMFEMSRETDVGVALYCRKVLIKSRTDNVLPKWLRFVKGVVDSEDIPLNLSRELLQDSALIRRLRVVLTNRIIRFLYDQMRKDADNYDKFYKDYSVFLKEGIITSPEQLEKEEIAKLLRYESSTRPAGQRISLAEYCGSMKPEQRDIYYLAAPSRALAESSPYLEALQKKDVDVLYCFEPYDELVFLQLRQFDKKYIISVEKEMRQQKDDVKLDEKSLSRTDADELMDWLKTTLGLKLHRVKLTQHLSSHPCVVTVEEMGAARHFVRTQFHSLPEEQRYKLLQPTLEINPNHTIIRKLSALRKENPKLAGLLAEQLMDNAMVTAGLIEDPRVVVTRMNELLELALEKH